MNKDKWLTVICGPMKSGKTNMLVARLNGLLRRKMRVGYFQIATFVKEKTLLEKGVRSWDGMVLETNHAFLVPPTFNFLDRWVRDDYDVFAIDEVQFLDEQRAVGVLTLSEQYGKRVFVSGFDVTFNGKPAENLPWLAMYADEVLKARQGECELCGAVARYSYRLSGGTELVAEVEKGAEYAPMCRSCYHAVVDKQGYVGSLEGKEA